MWIECGLFVVAYLLGSIPTGYIVGRIAGIDIREHGSGSTGATNVWRSVGKSAGSFVFTVDLLKGLVAVLLMQYASVLNSQLQHLGTNLPPSAFRLPPFQDWFVVGAAMLVLLGHSRSCWLGFKGGKSVASGFGVLLALNWIVALGAFGVWLATMAIWRTVSVSSIAAAIAAPVLMVLTQSPLAYSLLAFLGGLFVIWRHRSNIERLRQGTEPALFSNNKIKEF